MPSTSAESRSPCRASTAKQSTSSLVMTPVTVVLSATFCALVGSLLGSFSATTG